MSKQLSKLDHVNYMRTPSFLKVVNQDEKEEPNQTEKTEEEKKASSQNKLNLDRAMSKTLHYYKYEYR